MVEKDILGHYTQWYPPMHDFNKNIFVHLLLLLQTVYHLAMFSLSVRYQLIEAKWHIYASVNKAIIGSDNGLSPGRRQPVIWTNDVILLIGPLATNFSEILYQNSKLFVQENAFESVVCDMAAILSRPQCVKIYNFICDA